MKIQLGICVLNPEDAIPTTENIFSNLWCLILKNPWLTNNPIGCCCCTLELED